VFELRVLIPRPLILALLFILERWHPEGGAAKAAPAPRWRSEELGACSSRLR